MGTWVAEQEAPVNNIAGSIAEKYSSGWRYIFSFRIIVLIDGRRLVDGWVGRSFGRLLTRSRRRRCWPFPRPGIVLVRSFLHTLLTIPACLWL